MILSVYDKFKRSGKKGIIICGPTASGKSDVAERLYDLFDANDEGAAIVNADSMQVYGEFPQITAQPKISQRSSYYYHLYGFLSIINDNCSVASWLGFMHGTLKDMRATPIIVGGTGMYIAALLRGITNIPSVADDIVNKYTAFCDVNGTLAGYEQLMRCDSEFASKISKNDKQRIVRALSVYEQTGIPLSEWWKQGGTLESGAETSEERQYYMLYIARERSILRDRIARRFDETSLLMLDELREVVNKNGVDIVMSKCSKVIGVSEMLRHLSGEISYDVMRELIVNRTRQYAKRQNTWFKNQMTFDQILQCDDIL